MDGAAYALGMSFGTRLAETRKKKGLTQDQLGKGLATKGEDASKSVVYGWEKDQHFPRVDQLVLICEKLGCSSDWLLFGKQSTSALTPEVAEVAMAIDAIPKKSVREQVLTLTRQYLEFARENIAEQKSIGLKGDTTVEGDINHVQRNTR
jgi:transcriptional regulator with XRE-family HTH domain